MTDVGLKPRNIKKVAVIGGGLMGSGIATALLLSDISVIIKEIDSRFLQKGIKTIAGSSLIGEHMSGFSFMYLTLSYACKRSCIWIRFFSCEKSDAKTFFITLRKNHE